MNGTTGTTRPAGFPLEVDRIVENHPDGSHTHEVQLTLSPVQWRQIVGDIAARIQSLRMQGQPITSKLAGAGIRPCDLDQQDALTEVIRLLAMPMPTVSLDPNADEYERFLTDLDDAAGLVMCRCGRACHSGTECDVCAERHDVRRAG